MGPVARTAAPALEKTLTGNDYYLPVEACVALKKIDPANAKAIPLLRQLLE